MLFATIFDASLINKKYSDKPISFEIILGNDLLLIEDTGESGDSVFTNKTSKIIPETAEGHYWYLNFMEQFPCLHLLSTWPDYRKRMYICNMINKITDELVIENHISFAHILLLTQYNDPLYTLFLAFPRLNNKIICYNIN